MSFFGSILFSFLFLVCFFFLRGSQRDRTSTINTLFVPSSFARRSRRGRADKRILEQFTTFVRSKRVEHLNGRKRRTTNPQYIIMPIIMSVSIKRLNVLQRFVKEPDPGSFLLSCTIGIIHRRRNIKFYRIS